MNTNRTRPELDQVWVRLENALAPIRTRTYRARERVAGQQQRPGPCAGLLARGGVGAGLAGSASRQPRGTEGRTIWAKVATGEADDLPEMKQFHTASLARSRQLIQQWHRPEEPGRKEERPHPWRASSTGMRAEPITLTDDTLVEVP